MRTTYITARSSLSSPCAVLRNIFGSLCRGCCDAEYLDASCTTVVGVSGLAQSVPVLRRILRVVDVSRLLLVHEKADFLLAFDAETFQVCAFATEPGQSPCPLELPTDITDVVASLCRESAQWAGTLDNDGQHILDPRHPMPGPHFGVNLLVGDRIGFDYPLQTTPKSVVDALGRGSFRSHAATQVLATRWDLRQEENGFPANRQFYLTEGGRQFFYSGWTGDDLVHAQTVHRPNATRISVTTRCGLEVQRDIFLAAQEPGLPLACEIQQITLKNCAVTPRHLRLVYTGMFGPSKPGALMEDVLYSNIIMQAGMLRHADGSVLALAPDYHPLQDRDDIRFVALTVHGRGGRSYPSELGTDYREFVGQGTLEHPEGVGRLSNGLSRKGPGFFALATPLFLEPGESVALLSFTGLVSAKTTPQFGTHSLAEQVTALLARYDGPQAVVQAIKAKEHAMERHCAYLRFETNNLHFNAWANRNLPFQVFYQTFVSRSFDQTQKGYREIGFREVQDLLASMAPFCAEGRSDFIEGLLGQWAAQVHGFGFANHNFYWEGKEPGLWSDDALWLVQAVAKYVRLTGRIDFLDRPFPIAASHGLSRPLFETLQAIVHYSGRVSVGRHGLPLLDRADWNDCLKVDKVFLDGAAKQAAWELAQTTPSEGTESVMNAFLLKLAADDVAQLADLKGNTESARWVRAVSAKMTQACQTHAWKGTWYARLLVNRASDHPVVGAPGDGLATDGSDGSLFINSFSWAILSGVADEAHIAAMYPLLESRLKTPHGYRLVTAHDLRRVEPSVASAEYFPGDRENGAVFKHASLMAVLALFQAASQVKDITLAAAMNASAWNMIDLAAPYRTMTDPYVLAGNPRFCTQYSNSETGENIGPLLSGTASWSTLALRRGFGVELTPQGLHLDPLLREQDEVVRVDLTWQTQTYRITYRKPLGFVRTQDHAPTVTVNGKVWEGGLIPRVEAHTICCIEVVFQGKP